MKSKLVNRFLRYIKINTESNFESESVPSTQSQLKFSKLIEQELKDIGLSEISADEKGYVMATLPSNCDKKVPTIGFVAHMDTSPDFSGKNINPRIITKYDGKNIVLNEDKNIILETKKFPEILQYINQDIIVTDGTTLLGADDKAGMAEIITAMEYLKAHPEIKHGKIRIGFTPDEEIGRGADYFDVKKFGADFAYTMDGGEIGELEYENFNAAYAKIIFKGTSVHPGYAKNKMLNSMLIANDFMHKLPSNEIPECTDGYEGFFHLLSFKGSIENTELQYFIRDFDKEKFEERKALFRNLVNYFQKKHGTKNVVLELKDQYYNMKEMIVPQMHIIELVEKAMKELSIKPKIKPIRGGTDGSRLSFMGLPTPNIFAGGLNFHGKYEYIPIPSMLKATQLIIKIAELAAK